MFQFRLLQANYIELWNWIKERGTRFSLLIYELFWNHRLQLINYFLLIVQNDFGFSSAAFWMRWPILFHILYFVKIANFRLKKFNNRIVSVKFLLLKSNNWINWPHLFHLICVFDENGILHFSIYLTLDCVKETKSSLWN